MTLQLTTPEPFDFKQPDNWPKWKKRFEQFRVASGLATETEPRQVSTLLYCLGDEADDVLTSTNISADDRKKYDKVMEKFDAFFQARKNMTRESGVLPGMPPATDVTARGTTAADASPRQ